MSDRMIVMNKGKIEEQGDPDQIYQSPSTEYTKRLIAAIPAADPEAAARKRLLAMHVNPTLLFFLPSPGVCPGFEHELGRGGSYGE